MSECMDQAASAPTAPILEKKKNRLGQCPSPRQSSKLAARAVDGGGGPDNCIIGLSRSEHLKSLGGLSFIICLSSAISGTTYRHSHHPLCCLPSLLFSFLFSVIHTVGDCHCRTLAIANTAYSHVVNVSLPTELLQGIFLKAANQLC